MVSMKCQQRCLYIIILLSVFPVVIILLDTFSPSFISFSPLPSPSTNLYYAIIPSDNRFVKEYSSRDAIPVSDDKPFVKESSSRAAIPFPDDKPFVKDSSSREAISPVPDDKRFVKGSSFRKAINPVPDNKRFDKESSFREAINPVPNDVKLSPISHEQEFIPLLLNRSNKNIIFNDIVTTDLMPQYFDFAETNMAPQFEKYIQETDKIMIARLTTVKKYCELKKKYLIRSQNFLYYFPNHNVTWCPVFKAGSTNWKQFFCKQYRPDLYEEHIKDAADPYCPLGQLVNHRQNTWPNGRADWKLRTRKSLKFLTVRHPYERLVSVYNNKFKDCKSHMFTDSDMLEILKKYRLVDKLISEKEKAFLLNEARTECLKVVRHPNPHNPYMNPLGVTFKEFVQYITYNFRGVKFPDFHWVPISKGCDICIEEYDVIEKFETLERDHHYLLHKLGRPELLPLISGRHGNPSGHTTAQLFEYFNSLDETLLWHLSAIYKDDFDLFGYKPHFRVRRNPTKKQHL